MAFSKTNFVDSQTVIDAATLNAIQDELIRVGGLLGKDIQSATINDSGHLILTLTDGTTLDAGVAKGAQGEKGATGPAGPAGPAGAPGKDGTAGADGITPHIGDNGNWYIGSTDTGKPSRGAAGANGSDGAQGEKGATGPAGPAGPQGPAGEPGKGGAPGIVISSTQPTDEAHPVWLNPNGDADGEDFSLGISSATVDQIAKISAVDDNGVPTAWEPVDMPSGGGGREWVKIGEVTTAEDTTEEMHINFTKDVNGNLLSLKGVLIIGRALFSDTNQHQCSLVCNDDPYGGNVNYLLWAPVLRNGQFFTIYSEFLRADGVNSVAFTAFNAGNVKQNGGCESTINTWSPRNEGALRFPMRGVRLRIPDSGLLAGSKFEFWGVKA